MAEGECTTVTVNPMGMPAGMSTVNLEEGSTTSSKSHPLSVELGAAAKKELSAAAEKGGRQCDSCLDGLRGSVSDNMWWESFWTLVPMALLLWDLMIQDNEVTEVIKYTLILQVISVLGILVFVYKRSGHRSSAVWFVSLIADDLFVAFTLGFMWMIDLKVTDECTGKNVPGTGLDSGSTLICLGISLNSIKECIDTPQEDLNKKKLSHPGYKRVMWALVIVGLLLSLSSIFGNQDVMFFLGDSDDAVSTNAPASAGCQDDPPGWTDSENDGCDGYLANPTWQVYYLYLQRRSRSLFVAFVAAHGLVLRLLIARERPNRNFVGVPPMGTDLNKMAGLQIKHVVLAVAEQTTACKLFSSGEAFEAMCVQQARRLYTVADRNASAI